ncbi:MAG: long-chain fatty acid--CoA ligase, partial [Armatimonadetes bacterium]|nr:long-chain fatty acid--CoA ligase [Armatimonadota bacterium]
ARVLVAWWELEGTARAGMASAPACTRLILASDPGAGSVAGATDFAELVATAAALPAPVSTQPDDTAVILYTSGTTGRPKGAELTHFNVFENARWCAERSRSVLPERVVLFGPGYVSLSALPLFHSFGQVCVMNASLFHGGATVMMPRWDPDAALHQMEHYRITSFSGVPTMYFALLRAAAGRDVRLPHLRYCTSGGAPMPVEVITEFESRFPCEIMEGYGLSETSPVATFHTPEFERRVGSVGKAIDGCRVQIVDDQDRPLPPGEVGEVVIQGRNVMKGYYRRPEATAEAMRGGWFHSGDLGKQDPEGYLSIVDRKKDMILRGGFNVYPRELEEVLYGHPAILEAAVVGVPDSEHGEEVAAVVALRPGMTLTVPELTRFCRERMAAYKYPRLLQIRDALPKGPTGKILKRTIRDELAAKKG